MVGILQQTDGKVRRSLRYGVICRDCRHRRGSDRRRQLDGFGPVCGFQRRLSFRAFRRRLRVRTAAELQTQGSQQQKNEQFFHRSLLLAFFFMTCGRGKSSKKLRRTARPQCAEGLCPSQEDLSAAAADDLGLSPSHRDGLHRTAGGTAEKALLGAVAQAVADPLPAVHPKGQKPPSHCVSRGFCTRASRSILEK